MIKIYDLTNIDSRNTFRDKYIQVDGQFYKCNIKEVEGSGGTAEDGTEIPKTYYSYSSYFEKTKICFA